MILGIPVPDGVELHQAIQDWIEGPQKGKTSSGLAEKSVVFWLVVRLPKYNFSENLDTLDELPLLVASGTGQFIGVARTIKEVDLMTLDSSTKEGLPDGKWVYLTYKVKVENHKKMLDILRFLCENNMIESDERGI